MILRTKRTGRGIANVRGGLTRLGGRRPFVRAGTTGLSPPSRVIDANPQPESGRGETDGSASSADLIFSQDRPEDTDIFPVTVLKRTLTLTSDAIVLTLASPFFAVWWAYRMVKRLNGQK